MNRLTLLAASALVSCVLAAGPACAETVRDYSIPAGSLRDVLNAFATQSDQQIFVPGELVAGLRSPGLRGRYAPTVALDFLLRGTGRTHPVSTATS